MRSVDQAKARVLRTLEDTPVRSGSGRAVATAIEALHRAEQQETETSIASAIALAEKRLTATLARYETVRDEARAALVKLAAQTGAAAATEAVRSGERTSEKVAGMGDRLSELQRSIERMSVAIKPEPFDDRGLREAIVELRTAVADQMRATKAAHERLQGTIAQQIESLREKPKARVFRHTITKRGADGKAREIESVESP